MSLYPRIKQFLLGRTLPTSAAHEQRLNNAAALAVLSSDALSSVAYATEEILKVLVLAGSAFVGGSIWIALAIALLLLIITLSYQQTIRAYPNGGGAYIVAYENLGIYPGLVAAAALMIDYVLDPSENSQANIYKALRPFLADSVSTKKSGFDIVTDSLEQKNTESCPTKT